MCPICVRVFCLTLLMVSHSTEDAARIAERSLVIADGRIVWDGQTEVLLRGETQASRLLGIPLNDYFTLGC